MENPPGSDSSSAVTGRKDELSIAATCRNARVENTALGMRRKNLGKKLTIFREKLQKVEGDYWRQYHLRLDGTDKAASTKQWIGSFATKETAVVKQTRARMDELRRQIKVIEGQFQEADDQFWGQWQGYMTGLANIPPPISALPPTSSPTVPDSSMSSKPTCPPANIQQSKVSVKVNDTMAPPPPPRRTDVPAQSASKFAKVRPELATNAQRDIRPGQSDVQQVKTPAVSRPETFATSNVPAKAGNTTPSRPACTTASPLAPPMLFPHGPSPANFVTARRSSGNLASPAFVPPGSVYPVAAKSRASSHTHNAAALKDDIAPFQGVTSPKPGHIYKAYYKHDDHEGWWMCVVLPTQPAHESEAWEREVGITFPSANIDLWCDAPKCYDLTTEAKRKAGKSIKRHHVITGWHLGYRDGQPLVTERAFPVLFFEDRKGVHGHFNVPMPPKKFNFKPDAWDWVDAKNLRPVDADVGPVHGQITADKFAKRLEALSLGDDSSTPSSPTSSVDREGPAAKRRRVQPMLSNRRSTHARQHTPGYNEKEEDTEMADARSLSGDTIAASSVGQSDDESSKPFRIEPPVFAAPHGITTGDDRGSSDRNDG